MHAAPEVEKALTDAMTARRLAAGLRSRIEAAQREAEDADQRAAEAERTAGAEQSDVERLERLSWVHLWAALRGQHSTALEREKVEAEAARYTAATERRRAQAAAGAVADLRRQLDGLGDVDTAYAAALAAKERWLSENGGPGAARLAGIAEELGTTAAQQKEVAEALAAGTEADRLLAEASALLDSAAGWATWDMMGGGMLTDMAKHNKMNQAQRLLEQADQALKVFDRELADVMAGTGDLLQMDGFSYAFDVWFDNIFSDMAVSRRINQTRDQLARTRNQLQVLCNRLRVEGEALAQRRADLIAERESRLTA